jgi:hypothetical protein
MDSDSWFELFPLEGYALPYSAQIAKSRPLTERLSKKVNETIAVPHSSHNIYTNSRARQRILISLVGDATR